MLAGWDVLAFLWVVKKFNFALRLQSSDSRKAYLFQGLKVKITELDDVLGLVAQNFARVVLENGVEVFGQAKLLSVFGRHIFW